MKAASVAAALIVLALSACATKPPSPMLEVTAANCSAAPDLAGAIALPLKGEKAEPVEEPFDAKTPCFEPAPETKSLYRVFALPDAPGSLVVSVSSAPFGYGVFAPHVTMLDANGAPLREIPRERFIFRGSSLSVLFRSDPGERYLLVASDPTALGHSISRIEENTHSYMAVVGSGYFSIHTGSDTTQTLVYAANGEVTVALSRLPEAKPQG